MKTAKELIDEVVDDEGVSEATGDRTHQTINLKLKPIALTKFCEVFYGMEFESYGSIDHFLRSIVGENITSAQERTIDSLIRGRTDLWIEIHASGKVDVSI